jgi:hypothetical protein
VRYQVEDDGDAKRMNEAAARTRAGGAAGAITLRAARHRAAASRLPDSPLSGSRLAPAADGAAPDCLAVRGCRGCGTGRPIAALRE